MEGLYKRKRKVTERSWGAGALWMYVLLTICAMMYVNYRSNMCTVQAASANGTWGTCTWTLSEDGVLTVNSGTGEDVEYVDSQERRYFSVIAQNYLQLILHHLTLPVLMWMQVMGWGIFSIIILLCKKYVSEIILRLKGLLPLSFPLIQNGIKKPIRLL